MFARSLYRCLAVPRTVAWRRISTNTISAFARATRLPSANGDDFFETKLNTGDGTPKGLCFVAFPLLFSVCCLFLPCFDLLFWLLMCPCLLLVVVFVCAHCRVFVLSFVCVPAFVVFMYVRVCV